MTELPQYTGRMIGYARVSTEDQKLDLQIDALRKLGIPDIRIFTDKKSGKDLNRDGLKKAIRHCDRGDCLVVWKLDRLGRSTKDIIETVEFLKEEGVLFKTITDSIDTTTAMGTLVMTIFAAIAQMERDLTVERTKAGLEAARAKGRMPGRKSYILGSPKRVKLLVTLCESGDIAADGTGTMSASQVIDALNAVDKKAPTIKSHTSWSNWLAGGSKGFDFETCQPTQPIKK